MILGIAALVIGGAVSLAASSNPDGLEWSMERLTGSTELENDGTGAHAAAENIQEKTALLPDYGFKKFRFHTGNQLFRSCRFRSRSRCLCRRMLCISIFQKEKSVSSMEQEKK